MAMAATSAINTHEEVCAERWRSAMDTMSDIKRIVAWGVTGIIGAMAGLIGFLATHPPH